MSFMAKNPLKLPEINYNPQNPPSGFRGLFAKEDGWYDIGSDGNVKKITKSPSTFTIAPSNAINKERADLVLAGVSGVDDTDAINDALDTLHLARPDLPDNGGKDTSVAIRVDFLGGTINDIKQINIPDNFYLYGNGVVLNQVDFTDKVMTNNNAVLAGINYIFIDGFIINPSANTDPNGTSSYGIEVTTGNVSDCTVGNCGIGIKVGTGNVSDCTVGNCGIIGIYVYAEGNVSDCMVGDCYIGIYVYAEGNVSDCMVGNCGGNGIEVTTGNVSDCTVGNCGESGIKVGTGNVSDCTVGDCYTGIYVYAEGNVSDCMVGDCGDTGIDVNTGNATDCTVGACDGIGIYIGSGLNNIASGNIIKGILNYTTGIDVTGTNCIVTNNNLALKTGADSTYIVCTGTGTGTSARNNQLGNTFVAQGGSIL